MTFDVVVVRSQHIITSAYYNTGTLTVYGTSSVDVTIYVLYWNIKQFNFKVIRVIDFISSEKKEEAINQPTGASP